MNEKTQWSSPDLQSLVDIFYQQPSQLGEFREVSGQELPEAYRQLLDHNEHMTVTVESYFGSPVDVEVLDVHTTATHYSRKILLRTQNTGRVVQFGIVRLNRTQLPEHVMNLIEQQIAPLGRILIENRIMRNVKRLSLWEVTGGTEMSRAFAEGKPGADPVEPAVDENGVEVEQACHCYGRTAFLYLDSLPVVELLEIVKV